MVANLVHDATFGSYVISPLCQSFLDTPEHWRLKHIIMSHADIVFPSITYSRREHCLSVMHLAREWASRLTTDQRTIDLIALAGLYHDVGHITTSHALDDYMHTVHNVPDHEERSLRIVTSVNQRLGLLTPSEERFVKNCIVGTPGSDGSFPLWTYRIVHNVDPTLPDVDRITYLIHDANRLGFPCTFDPGLIMRNIVVGPDTGDLEFGLHCLPELRRVSAMRLRHFGTVFHHPRVLAYQKALCSTFIRVFGETRLLELFSGDGWLALTDVLLWTELAKDEEISDKLTRGCF